jgi:DNA repair protein RadC
MSIKGWPEHERPRERLLKHGPTMLSDAELLAIVLRTGSQGESAVELARKALSHFGDLATLVGADRRAFCSVKGLGPAKYAELQAVMALAERVLEKRLSRSPSLQETGVAKTLFQARLCRETEEVFAALFLDNQHRPIHFANLFKGTIDAASVHPRVLVREALRHNAAALIVGHNHPSGICEPSHADRQITRRIRQSLELIDVRLLDHIVVGAGEALSFAEEGLL